MGFDGIKGISVETHSKNIVMDYLKDKAQWLGGQKGDKIDDKMLLDFFENHIDGINGSEKDGTIDEAEISAWFDKNSDAQNYAQNIGLEKESFLKTINNALNNLLNNEVEDETNMKTITFKNGKTVDFGPNAEVVKNNNDSIDVELINEETTQEGENGPKTIMHYDKDGNYLGKTVDSGYHKNAGTIIEYDENGNVVKKRSTINIETATYKRLRAPLI